jgi:hypothetical protein
MLARVSHRFGAADGSAPISKLRLRFREVSMAGGDCLFETFRALAGAKGLR